MPLPVHHDQVDEHCHTVRMLKVAASALRRIDVDKTDPPIARLIAALRTEAELIEDVVSGPRVTYQRGDEPPVHGRFVKSLGTSVTVAILTCDGVVVERPTTGFDWDLHRRVPALAVAA